MTSLATFQPTLAEAAFPRRFAVQPALEVAAAALMISGLAQLAVPLPFTPVPLTGQTLGVLYAGALLGPGRGAASALLYVLLGAAGLPFFAGGAGGAGHLAGPTAGYLAGFVPAAWLTGRLARRGWDRTPAGAFAAMLLGSSLIFACGLAGLSRFVPANELLAKGLYPFIPGDLLKAALSAGLLPLGWRVIGREPR